MSKHSVFAGAALAAILSPLGARAASSLTNATLFRADATGTNLGSSGGAVSFGVWTSVLDQQNVPGNYMAELFLAKTPSPAPADFLSPAAALSLPLSPGANTFYFWGDGDDARGGTASFGLNLYANSAGSSNPTISAFAAPGAGQTVFPDASSSTGGYDGQVVHGSGALSFVPGGQVVTLTSFEVTGIGGASAGAGSMDLVNSTNTAAFTPPPHPDGITDTFGYFTLTVTPEPVALPAIALAGFILRRRRKAPN